MPFEACKTQDSQTYTEVIVFHLYSPQFWSISEENFKFFPEVANQNKYSLLLDNRIKELLSLVSLVLMDSYMKDVPYVYTVFQKSICSISLVYIQSSMLSTLVFT
ncbi:hypothetical protein AMTRI_Chr05g65150 [Amborella trichopoda]